MDRCTDRHAQLPLCRSIYKHSRHITLQAYIGNTIYIHICIITMVYEWDAAESVCAGVCILSESAVSYMIICSEYKKRIACQTN